MSGLEDIGVVECDTSPPASLAVSTDAIPPQVRVGDDAAECGVIAGLGEMVEGYGDVRVFTVEILQPPGNVAIPPVGFDGCAA
jgi:hypothetical protein